MRHNGTRSVLIATVAVALCLGSFARAQDSSTRPPTNLKLVGDHWTAWEAPAAGPDAYVIQKGDTLWDLAGQWLGDPFLWPQVWDENRYILDSHWIYPGDPLVVPGRPTVVPEEPPVAEELPPTEEQPSGEVAQGEPTPQAPVMQLVAGPSDVYCAGFIEPEHEVSKLWIAGTEEPEQTMIYGEGDVIYLSQGKNQGLSPGDEFTVLRAVRKVEHPTTGQVMGTYIRRLGKVRVMLTQEDTSTAMIEMSCTDIHLSDELVPWTPIPIPRRAEMPVFDRFDVTPSGGPVGEIVAMPEEIWHVAEGDVINVDLGLASGVAPGDVLTMYRPQTDLPRLQIGQAVVLTVEPTSSTVKIHYSVRESVVGDKVEVVR
jgi:hypothetical protein